MYAFQVCGYSNSGKTFLVKELIGRLSADGVRIHFKDFQLDTEGKDTAIHKKAGANPVIARGLKETDILYDGQLDLPEIVKQITADWLIVEGYNDFPLPKIVCGKSEEEISDFMDGRTFAISGVFGNAHKTFRGSRVYNPLDPADMNDLVRRVKETVFPFLPYVDESCCSHCGMSCKNMVEAIVQGKKKCSDCIVNNASISLKIGGKDIPLVGFVQNILRSSVLGIVSELKGWKKGQQVEIVIDDDYKIK